MTNIAVSGHICHAEIINNLSIEMEGETNLNQILKTMKPKQNSGNYVFCTVSDMIAIPFNEVIMSFREEEGTTVILRKELADDLKLKYSFIASWITLAVHSSLQAVGFTAAFSNALSKEGISCNVVAAYYHDHIFVDEKDTGRAMNALNAFSRTGSTTVL